MGNEDVVLTTAINTNWYRLEPFWLWPPHGLESPMSCREGRSRVRVDDRSMMCRSCWSVWRQTVSAKGSNWWWPLHSGHIGSFSSNNRHYSFFCHFAVRRAFMAAAIPHKEVDIRISFFSWHFSWFPEWTSSLVDCLATDWYQAEEVDFWWFFVSS